MANPRLFAPSASDSTRITPIAPSATSHPFGTTPDLLTAPGTSKASYSTRAATLSAGTSSVSVDVQVKDITMNVLTAMMSTTVPKNAPAVSVLSACLRSRTVMPYNANGWTNLLISLNIAHKYPDLPNQLIHGFHTCTPTITCSFTPANNPSINTYCDTFNEILQKEFAKQHYIGLFTLDTLESFLGPVQSSPLNIIPKPGKPGKF